MKHAIVRKEVIGIAALTVIALVSMWRITDPDNIVTNCIIGITGLLAATASKMRKSDGK
jgi:hypothetical protein